MYHLTYGQTERQRERQRDRETERQRDRETERQRDRETERQRDRETERQRETDIHAYIFTRCIHIHKCIFVPASKRIVFGQEFSAGVYPYMYRATLVHARS